MDFEIKEEPLYDNQFQLESGEFIAHNGGYVEHFAQEICTDCDQRLLRIGASLFVLHTKITCVKVDSDRTMGHGNLSPAIEQSAKHPSNEIFIKEEMEPSFKLPIVHNVQCEERLPQGTESIFFDGSKNTYEINDNNLNDEDHLSSEKLKTIIDERDVNCKIRNCARVVRKKHVAAVHVQETNLTCDICHKSNISTRQALKRHMRLSHRPKDEHSITTYTCDYCQIEIRGRPLLHRHMKLNHDPDYKRPKCEICKKTFMDIQKVRQHEKAIHLDERFICGLCGKSLKSEYNLKTHRRQHTGETPYKCSFDGCTKAFRSKDTMARHQFTHTGEKQFKCNERGCERLFLFKNDMNKHIKRVHMKQQQQPELSQFVCFTCGKEYKLRSKLIEHERIHSGERPFKCAIVGCDKTFRTASLLSNHKRYHSQEKRYRCDQQGCERAYAYDIDLKRHKYGAHGIWWKKFPCPICENRIFPENKLLNRHLKARHGLLNKTM